MGKPSLMQEAAKRRAALISPNRVSLHIAELQEEREEVRVNKGMEPWDREWRLAEIDAEITALYNRSDWQTTNRSGV